VLDYDQQLTTGGKTRCIFQQRYVRTTVVQRDINKHITELGQAFYANTLADKCYITSDVNVANNEIV